MADIINLRQKRKEKKRSDKSQQASGNRALFGESKNVKSLSKKEKAQVEKTVEGAKRDKPEMDHPKPLPLTPAKAGVKISASSQTYPFRFPLSRE
jgi:hypothetical protein